MKIFSWIIKDTSIDFLGYRKIAYTITAVLLIASVVSVAVRGFNYGIDFSGGILMEVKTQGVANIEQIRNDLHKFSPEIQSEGTTGDLLSIRLPRGNKNEAEIAIMLNEVKQTLGPTIEYRNTQIVGPKVGSDLVKNSVFAVLLSVLAISLYIWARFELPFAVGAGLSLAHDIILALGMIIILRIEFDLTTLASLLTLAGYSINDTVVIYDRIRENLKRYKNKSLSEIIDLSINETFSRTILTGITTIFAVLSILVFGGEVLRGFSSVMLFGIIIGTYSSTLLSTSSLLMFKKRMK